VFIIKKVFKMKYIRGLALAGLLSVLPLASHAAGCAAPKGAFDNVYCTSTLYAQLDRDFNTQYKRLRGMISSAQKTDLRDAQRGWIEDRNRHCSRTENGSYFVNLDCAILMTEQRMEYLQNRERECQSTGCNSDALRRH
jgi:uncharacterized protein YecT (DUF1311 family)